MYDVPTNGVGMRRVAILLSIVVIGGSIVMPNTVIAAGLMAVAAGEVNFIDAAIVVAIGVGVREMRTGLVAWKAGKVDSIDAAIVIVVGGHSEHIMRCSYGMEGCEI